MLHVFRPGNRARSVASSDVIEPDLGANGIPQHRDAAGALAADEAPVLATFGDAGDEDLDRGLDHPVRVELAGARTAQHVAQGPERLVDQDQPEGLHRFEVPVERRGDDAGLPGHLTQAQAAEAVVVEQLERRGDDGPPSRLLALLPRRAVARLRARPDRRGRELGARLFTV